jgi:hypothetical protein
MVTTVLGLVLAHLYLVMWGLADFNPWPLLVASLACFLMASGYVGYPVSRHGWKEAARLRSWSPALAARTATAVQLLAVALVPIAALSLFL